MLVEETFRVKAPIEKLWQFMLDPEEMGSCIPGCEKIELLGENTYESTIRVNSPIFSITVKSKTTISEISPPHHLKWITQGQYNIGSGTFQQESVVDLKQISDGEVEVSYSGNIELAGGLAGLGEKIVSSMGRGLAIQFVKNIQEKLERRYGDRSSGAA
ncbi:MAG: CoxG family protein [Thermodesulfobacteriota bacterium]